MDILGFGIQSLGIVALLILCVICTILTLAIFLGYVLMKRGIILLPRVSLYILNNYYPILLKFFLWIGTEYSFYNVAIDFYNKYYYKKFLESKRKVLILPHCLRDLECPAKLGKDGIKCIHCKKCPLGDLIKAGEECGYMATFIVPGSTFMKRLLRECKPDGIFAVACHVDLFMGMNGVSKLGIPVQGVLLLKDGCVCTIVDKEEVIRRLKETCAESKH
ncbi:DUF116 domain-containing protein [Methanococcus voltae]|uniref:DUF116 domain-containing protein n=1 Tax=Methanococcus voltae (strain ATCC BAA-1334 / A3) TaxID=456320 RepID=D7DQT0_METV3|nr:DUF116 domain-containing protein [Methanococcus voltae]MCS3900867.1 hypothetical protein [Methanococcus voltae]